MSTSVRESATELRAVHARCLTCRWESRARNAHGNAARHHDTTAHPVQVDVTRTTTYGDPQGAAPGQESLMDHVEGADREAVAA